MTFSSTGWAISAVCTRYWKRFTFKSLYYTNTFIAQKSIFSISHHECSMHSTFCYYTKEPHVLLYISGISYRLAVGLAGMVLYVSRTHEFHMSDKNTTSQEQATWKESVRLNFGEHKAIARLIELQWKETWISNGNFCVIQVTCHKSRMGNVTFGIRLYSKYRE